MAGTIILAAAAPTCFAAAQETIHDPDAIRVCLCRDHAVTALAQSVRQDDEEYDARRKELQDLDSRIDQARQNLDDSDAAAREALGRLLTERDAARERFAAQVTPHHNALVDRYNTAVTGYSENCAGKSYDAEVLSRVRASLACPPES